MELLLQHGAHMEAGHWGHLAVRLQKREVLLTLVRYGMFPFWSPRPHILFIPQKLTRPKLCTLLDPPLAPTSCFVRHEVFILFLD